MRERHTTSFSPPTDSDPNQAATMEFTPLWRWLVRLSVLQVVAQAFAPSILRFPPRQQHLSQLTTTARFPASTTLPCGQRSVFSRTSYLQTKTTETVDGYVEAEDLDGLQDLFNRYCDREGLMTKNSVQQIPAIAELLVGSMMCVSTTANDDSKCSRITPRSVQERTY